jgi:hypothetical protein
MVIALTRREWIVKVGRNAVAVCLAGIAGFGVMVPAAIVPGKVVQFSTPNGLEPRPVPGSGSAIDPDALAAAALNGLLLAAFAAAAVLLARRSPWLSGRWSTAAWIAMGLGISAVYVNALRPSYVRYECSSLFGVCFREIPGRIDHITTLAAVLNGVILFGVIAGAALVTRRIRRNDATETDRM